MSEQLDALIHKLIARLKHQDPTTRRNAAAALRLHGARAVAAVAELTALLADNDPGVRREAQRALERLHAPAA